MEDFTTVNEKLDLLKKMEAINSDDALSKVKRRIAKNRTNQWGSYLQKAAAFLILPVLAFAIWQYVQNSRFDQQVSQHKVSTPPTLRSEFVLPDGTKVWMNGNTSLSYPSSFIGDERLVELSGEAYFDVAHNKKKPFMVRSGKLIVKALGTEFNLATYSDDHTLQALLTEGAVEILIENKEEREQVAKLKPNDLLVYDKEKGKLKVLEVDPEKYVSWKKGQLIFKNDMMSDVLKKLSRWYNVEFVFDATIGTDYSFTGSFEGEDLSRILKYIELTTPIQFTDLPLERGSSSAVQKRKIQIRPK